MCLVFVPPHLFSISRTLQTLRPSHSGSGLVGIVFVVAALAVGMVIVFFLLPADQRKKFIRRLAQFAVAGVIIFLILGKINTGVPVEPDQAEQSGYIAITPTPTGFLYIFVTPEPTITPAEYIQPQIPDWTSYLVAFIILLLAAGAGGYWIWYTRKNSAPYQQLASIAQSALDDIDAGRDWGDAIVDSYFRMNKAVAEWLGLRRKTSMTPAEFADSLISAHLPADAVLRLTSLFERIRYGGKKSNRRDIREAVECLTAILKYCKESR